MRLVMKFGGSSLADADCIRRCAGLVRSHQAGNQVLVVVSAMGGVTDMLIELAEAAAAGSRAVAQRLLGDLRERHETAASSLGGRDSVAGLLAEMDSLVAGISAVGELTPRLRDAVVSFGERLSAQLVAAALEGRALTGQEAGIVTDDAFGEAEPLLELTRYQVREALDPSLGRGDLIVVTGFLAATQHGVMTTLGRGGSDYTATILGAALSADEVWIWTDVDGLMSADPRVVPEARLLETITFGEAIEMGQLGAKSMHPRALEPAAQDGIPVRMRNTFNPDCQGTRIEDGTGELVTVRAVLGMGSSVLITVSGAAMVGRPGTAAHLFEALARQRVNVQMISQSVSEASISVVVARNHLDRAQAALEAQLLRSGVARDVAVEEDVMVVAVVGSGMAGMPGVAARVFGAAARGGVNVMAIAQGSSELSICFVVAGGSGLAVLQALHDEFALSGGDG